MGSCRSNCTETCLQRKARHWWEQAWGVCVQCRGIVRASLLSKGFLTQLSTCKLPTEDSPAFPGLFANAASELPYLAHSISLSVLPCSCTAVFWMGSCRSDCLAKLFCLLLRSVCGSFPCPRCLPGTQQQVLLLWGLIDEIQKCELCDY